MAISFACPNCKTLIQVGEELTGQTGQCPRCKKLILIPSAHTPVPVLLDEEGRPVPTAPPLSARKDKPAPAFADDDDGSRSRRDRPAVQKTPAGPTWPWALGVCGAIVIVILLFSSFVTLFTYRPREVKSNLIVVDQRRANFSVQGVTRGRLEGNRAFMQDRAFQIRSTITRADPIDERHGHWHHKRFEIELRNDRSYFIETDSKQMNTIVRVEEKAGFNLRTSQGFNTAKLEYFPEMPAIHIVYASFVDHGLGEFTLTIRERDEPKPFVP